jgi:hypothetical protein
MDLEALLAKEGRLTDEEMAFIEQNLLVMSRAFVSEIAKLTRQMEAEEPELARQLEASAASVLLNVEKAVNIDVPQAAVRIAAVAPATVE